MKDEVKKNIRLLRLAFSLGSLCSFVAHNNR
jgi:hypothetical protein